jgi:exodeoxyribonuclease VII small subunit
MFPGQYNPGLLMTVNRKPSSAPATPASYEAALEELERLVAAMEGQQLPLEQLLESYKRGAELLGFCRSKLQAIEQQVKVLDSESLKAEEDF